MQRKNEKKSALGSLAFGFPLSCLRFLDTFERRERQLLRHAPNSEGVIPAALYQPEPPNKKAGTQKPSHPKLRFKPFGKWFYFSSATTDTKVRC